MDMWKLALIMELEHQSNNGLFADVNARHVNSVTVYMTDAYTASQTTYEITDINRPLSVIAREAVNYHNNNKRR